VVEAFSPDITSLLANLCRLQCQKPSIFGSFIAASNQPSQPVNTELKWKRNLRPDQRPPYRSSILPNNHWDDDDPIARYPPSPPMHKDGAGFADACCDFSRITFGRNKQSNELDIDSLAPRNNKRNLDGRMRAGRHSLKNLRWHTAQHLERHRGAFVIEASR
jgi:hypothetical protein